MSVSDVGAVVRPLNRPRLDEQQIVVGRIDVGPLKRLNRPRPNGLQTVVVQGDVEVLLHWWSLSLYKILFESMQKF